MRLTLGRDSSSLMEADCGPREVLNMELKLNI